MEIAKRMGKRMNPDCWIPFYGADFFGAVEGHEDIMAMGYLRALWHYWHHYHCSGLPDDDKGLQRICRIENSAWARTRGAIFDNEYFFSKENGKWHQKRAKELFDEAVSIYQKRMDASAKGMERRVELGQIQPYVEPSVEPVVSPTVTIGRPERLSYPQLQSQSQSEEQSEKQSLKKKPTLEEVKLCCSKTGLPDSDAVWFWNKCEGNGWTNAGKAIKSWPHVIAAWKAAGYMPSQKNKPAQRPVGGNF